MIGRLIFMSLLGATLTGCTFTERVADRLRDKPADAQASSPVQRNCIAKVIENEKVLNPDGVPVTVTDYGNKFSVNFTDAAKWGINHTLSSPNLLFMMSDNKYIYSSTPTETYMKGVGNMRGHYVVKVNYHRLTYGPMFAIYKCDA